MILGETRRLAAADAGQSPLIQLGKHICSYVDVREKSSFASPVACTSLQSICTEKMLLFEHTSHSALMDFLFLYYLVVMSLFAFACFRTSAARLRSGVS